MHMELHMKLMIILMIILSFSCSIQKKRIVSAKENPHISFNDYNYYKQLYQKKLEQFAIKLTSTAKKNNRADFNGIIREYYSYLYQVIKNTDVISEIRLYDLEIILRELNSHLYLVATPINEELIKKYDSIVVWLPDMDQDSRNYYLGIYTIDRLGSKNIKSFALEKIEQKVSTTRTNNEILKSLDVGILIEKN